MLIDHQDDRESAIVTIGCKMRVWILVLALSVFVSGSLHAQLALGGDLRIQHHPTYIPPAPPGASIWPPIPLPKEFLEHYVFEANVYLVPGSVFAPPASFTGYVYRLRDQVLVDEITLRLDGFNSLAYSNPDCSPELDDFFQTEVHKLSYSASIFTTSFHEPDIDKYADEGGYFMVVPVAPYGESRNYDVKPKPISSADEELYLYMEFPRLVDETFTPMTSINSSPELNPVANDFAIKDQPYYVILGGGDEQGDEVRMSVVDPLSFHPEFRRNRGAPDTLFTLPKFHKMDLFPGFDPDRQIPSDPRISVSTSGILTLTPTEKTPQAFKPFFYSVLFEEYRDNKKIGEVRRTFKVTVFDEDDLDFINLSVKPKVDAYDYNSTDVVGDNDEIHIPANEIDKKVDLLITDQDLEEVVFLQAIPVNFRDPRFSSRLSILSDSINGTDTLRVSLDLDDCPVFKDEPLIIDVVAIDDACAVPLADTLRLTVFIENLNVEPKFDLPDDEINVQINEGDSYTLNIPINDANNDLIVLDTAGLGFDPSAQGMILTNTVDEAGRHEAFFEWHTDCTQNSFSDKTSFTLLFIAEDLDDCNFVDSDTLKLNIDVGLPVNAKPSISSPRVTAPIQEIEFSMNEPLCIDINGFDADNDPVSLRAVTPFWFTLDDYEMEFEEKVDVGRVTSQFKWNPNCDNVDVTVGAYEIQFVAEDLDKCSIQHADTITIRLKMKEVLPEVAVNIETDQPGCRREDGRIRLDYVSGQGCFSYELTDDQGSLISYNDQFSGEDDFNIGQLNEGFYYLKSVNQVTGFERIDTLALPQLCLEVITPNVFKPDASGKNAYFSVLPSKVVDSFKITIYNRWGKPVFISEDKNFKWDGTFNGEPLPMGTYRYEMVFNGNFDPENSLTKQSGQILLYR